MNEYISYGTSATFTVVDIRGGGYDLSNPDPKASLNMQYTEAIAYPTPHIFYSTGGSNAIQDNPFINWLDYVLSQTNVPQTISTSYGADEYKFPPDYAIHVCRMLALLGLRGASVLFASGNDGVGRGNCLFSNDCGNLRVNLS